MATPQDIRHRNDTAPMGRPEEPTSPTPVPASGFPPPPVVGAGVWSIVMEAAGYRCQCTGQCGNAHRKSEGRCEGMHGGYAGKARPRLRLEAAPADPAASEVAAAALPVAELVAWCPPCRSAAVRGVRPKRTAPAPQDALW